jgi:hypothetical protein
MANSQHDPVVAQVERQKLTASPLHHTVYIFTQRSHHLAHCEHKICRGTNAPLRECC